MFLTIHLLSDWWWSHSDRLGFFLTLLVILVGISNLSFVLNRWNFWVFLHFGMNHEFYFLVTKVTRIRKIFHRCSNRLTLNCYIEEFRCLSFNFSLTWSQVLIQGICYNEGLVCCNIIWQFCFDIIREVRFCTDGCLCQCFVDFLINAWFWWRRYRYRFGFFFSAVIILICETKLRSIWNIDASHSIIDLSWNDQFNFLTSKIICRSEIFHGCSNGLTVNCYIEEGCSRSLDSWFAWSFIDDWQISFKCICNHKFLVICNICWKFCLNVVVIRLTCRDI